MPLTKTDRKIMRGMKKSYGSDKKAKQVFYASANAGKLGADVKARHGSAGKHRAPKGGKQKS
jgi:hypothetical protein